MLCWICPECGRDCSPAVRECPACTQTDAKVTKGVLAMVESLRAVPAFPLLTAAPEQYLLFGLTNGHSTAIPQSSIAVEEAPAPTGETIDSLVRPLVESAKTAEFPAPDAPLAPFARYTEMPAPPLEPAPQAKSCPPAKQLTELAIPEAPARNGTSHSTKIAPAIQPTNPVAAEPPAREPMPPAQPSAFVAPQIQIAELPIPAVEPTAPTAPAPAAPEPLVAPRNLPAYQTLSANGSAIAASSNGIKFVELPAPPPQPARTAPLVKLVNLPAARQPVEIATEVPEPRPFRASAIRTAQRRVSSILSVRTARAVDIAWPAAARVPARSENGPVQIQSFRSGIVVMPRYAPVSEPFCAAAGLAHRTEAIHRAIELHAESILEEIRGRVEAYESEIRAIVSTFRVKPRVCLLAPPKDIVTAPAPPDFQWMKAPRPELRMGKLSERKCDASTAPPQKLPLAGPCLPPELQNYIEASPAQRIRRKKSIGLPAWLLSLVIATTLFLGAGSAIQYLTANRDAKAASIAPAAGQALASAPAPLALEPHPFGRFVEVTGLRVVADLNHRSQVQYIVVNHSAAQLAGMQLRIVVRSSANPPGAPPLFTVSTVIPSLGPHQSKEIRTDLDSELRSSAIPDWEYLRTEVQVVTQN